MNIFRRINFALLALHGEGSWKLTALERLVLQAVGEYILKNEAEKLKSQITKVTFIERTNPCIATLHLADWADDIRIDSVDFGKLLLKVKVEVNSQKETVNVTFLDGFCSSIETRNPSHTYRDTLIKVIAVQPGNPKISRAAAIDRFEHGKDA